MQGAPDQDLIDRKGRRTHGRITKEDRREAHLLRGTRRSGSASGSSRGNSRGSKAPARRPMRREIGAAVCLALALFAALGYFHIQAIFIDFFSGLLKGLLGYGFWLMPPALLLAAYILAFHRGRPVRLRVTCALLLPLLFSCIVHGLLGRVLPGTPPW